MGLQMRKNELLIPQLASQAPTAGKPQRIDPLSSGGVKSDNCHGLAYNSESNQHAVRLCSLHFITMIKSEVSAPPQFPVHFNKHL